MADLRGVPPGRMGRLWLRRRLAAAQRGASLLDRKLRALRGERDRLASAAAGTGQAWADSYASARAWLSRAAMLGGERELRMAVPSAPAAITMTWRSLMGVRYPLSIQVETGRPESGARPPGTSAVVLAAAGYAEALSAAAEHAAASAALALVDQEIAATSQRLRAINQRWIPRVREALKRLEDQLEETERDDATRLRRRGGGP